jgi:hypothetical protein
MHFCRRGEDYVVLTVVNDEEDIGGNATNVEGAPTDTVVNACDI